MSMRGLLTFIAFAAALSATAEAQTRTTPSVAPPVVFPFPPIMQPPAGGLSPHSPFQPSTPIGAPRDLFRVGSGDRVPPSRPLPFGFGYNAGIAYAVQPSAPPPSAPAPVRPATGVLRLSVTPLSAHVFVDGRYVGSAGDIEAQRGLTLDVGPHPMEIRAPGYDTVSVVVQIAMSETITYRAALTAVQPPPTVAVPAGSRGPLYIIPRCYAGNVPPREDRLPAGCKVADVVVLAGR